MPALSRPVAPLMILSLIAAPDAARAESAGEEEPGPIAQLDVETRTKTGPTIHFLVETSLASTYVFRGAPQYLEKSDPSSQTTLALTIDELGPGSLALGLWNATALTGYGDQPGTKLELDLTATYTIALTDRLAASVGYLVYLYPESDPVDGSHELSAALSFASELVTPTLAVVAKLVRLRGVYAMLGLSRDVAMGAFTISPGVSVGLSGYEGQDFGLNDVSACVLGKWEGQSGLYAGASVNYAYDGVPDEGSLGERSTLWAMAFVGFSR
jgi:uncharacterized protein (TIGR02001 family)